MRIMGGLHPVDVLLLMDVLEMTCVLPLIGAVLYAASFAAPKLNTAGAVAVTGLFWILVLTFILIVALIRISL